MSGLFYCYFVFWFNKIKGGGSLFIMLCMKRNCGKYYIIKCKIFKLLYVNILLKMVYMFKKIFMKIKRSRENLE